MNRSNWGKPLLGSLLLSLSSCTFNTAQEYVRLGEKAHPQNLGGTAFVLDTGTPKEIDKAADKMRSLLGRDFDQISGLYLKDWLKGNQLVLRNVSFSGKNDLKSVSSGSAYIASEWGSMAANVPGGFDTIIAGLENLKKNKPGVFEEVLQTLRRDPVNPLMAVGRYQAVKNGSYPTAEDQISYRKDPKGYAWVEKWSKQPLAELRQSLREIP